MSYLEELALSSGFGKCIVVDLLVNQGTFQIKSWKLCTLNHLDATQVVIKIQRFRKQFDGYSDENSWIRYYQYLLNN